MAKFKKGDKVKLKQDVTRNIWCVHVNRERAKDKPLYVVEDDSRYPYISLEFNGGPDGCVSENDIELWDDIIFRPLLPRWHGYIQQLWASERMLENLSELYASNTGSINNTNNTNNTNKTMSLIQTFKSIIRTEPEKSFVKAGVLDESLELTHGGTALFIQYLFEKNKEDFKTSVIDVILAEQSGKAGK